jgi:aminoglycoside/choline kinase family phosphotransferase
MTNNEHEDLLSRYFHQVTGCQASSITPLRPHASERRIYRLTAGAITMIGVFNPLRQENDTFVAFARYFRSRGLPVPEIYHYAADHNLYLEEDLGDQTLYDLLSAERAKTPTIEFPQAAEALYIKSLEYLPLFQIESAAALDFSLCYPEKDLLPGTFAGDCAAFSTELVTRLLPAFDISLLTRDFALLISFLEQADDQFFVYRDFQSRNIMYHKGLPYFIDFQSGRRGPLQYDVVSLLYQSSTQIPQSKRESLTQHYITAASRYTPIDAERFNRFFSGFIVARMLQVLGVYGRQGLGAGKTYFRDSIPAAVNTLHTELSRSSFPLALPGLCSCVDQLLDFL